MTDHHSPSDVRGLRCRFGCADALYLVEFEEGGCVCFPDRIQALCAQHWQKSTPMKGARVILTLGDETCGDANLPEQLLMDCHDRMAFALEEIVDLKVSAPSPLGPLFGAGMSKGFEIATDIANRALEASCSPEQHDSAQQQSAQNGGTES